MDGVWGEGVAASGLNATDGGVWGAGVGDRARLETERCWSHETTWGTMGA